jgi:hypothetical protein
MKRVLAAIALAASLAPTGALADPDEPIACKRIIVKAATFKLDGTFKSFGLVKVFCKGTFTMPSPGAAPMFMGLGVRPDPPGVLSPNRYVIFIGVDGVTILFGPVIFATGDT